MYTEEIMIFLILGEQQLTFNQMVFLNMGMTSGTGVALQEPLQLVLKELFGEFLMNAQGEDVVAGIRLLKCNSKLNEKFPECYEQFKMYVKT